MPVEKEKPKLGNTYFVTNGNRHSTSYGQRLWRSVDMRGRAVYYGCNSDGTAQMSAKIDPAEVTESFESMNFRLSESDARKISRRGTRSPQRRLNIWAKRYDVGNKMVRDKHGNVLQRYLTDDQLRIMSGFSRKQWYDYYLRKINDTGSWHYEEGGPARNFLTHRRAGYQSKDAAKLYHDYKIDTTGAGNPTSYKTGSDSYRKVLRDRYEHKQRRNKAISAIFSKLTEMQNRLLAMHKAIKEGEPTLHEMGHADLFQDIDLRIIGRALCERIQECASVWAYTPHDMARHVCNIHAQIRFKNDDDRLTGSICNNIQYDVTIDQDGKARLHWEGQVVGRTFYTTEYLVKHAKTCPCCGKYVMTKDTPFIKFIRDEGDEDLYPDFNEVCGNCIQRKFHQWNDGTWHTSPHIGRCALPDQGPSERETDVWKKMFSLFEQTKPVVLKREMANNAVTLDGINAIVDWMKKSLRLNPYASVVRDFMLKEGPGIDSHAPTVEWATRGGTLPKRISRFLKESHAVVMTNDELGGLGSVAGAFCPKSSTFCFDVTSGKRAMSWSPGDFGDRGSCLWGEQKSYVRWQFETQHNAFALRFFNPEAGEKPGRVLHAEKAGIGRCWCIVQKGNLFLFNAYGPHSLLTTARMLGDMFGMKYRDVPRLVNKEGRCPIFYINSNKGFVVGPADDPEKLPAAHDFNITVQAAG